MTPLVQPEASARVLAVVGFRCLADGQPENLIYRPGATAPEFLASAANGRFPRNRRSAYDFSLGFTRFRCRSVFSLQESVVGELNTVSLEGQVKTHCGYSVFRTDRSKPAAGIERPTVNNVALIPSKPISGIHSLLLMKLLEAEIGSANKGELTDLVTHFSRGLSPFLVPLLAAASALGLSGLSVEVGLGLVLLSERPLAVAAASALGLPGLSVEDGPGLVLLSELLRLLFAAAVRVGRLDRPAGSAAD